MQQSEMLAAAIGATEASIHALSIERRQEIATAIRAHLGVDICLHQPSDSIDAPAGVRRGDGWKLIAQFVGAKPGYVFLDGADEIFEFQSGNDLELVLEECPPVEFYVCSGDFSFLLCHNHHDYVVGWGKAASWVASLAEAT